MREIIETARLAQQRHEQTHDVQLGMDEDILAGEYRTLYWELNQWQLIISDDGCDKDAVQQEIDKCNNRMTEIAERLGYVPVA